MIDNQVSAPMLVRNSIPQLHSRWWTALLVLSLGANLLVAGLVAGHAFMAPPGGMAAPGFGQLVPRKFFGDLPRDRRRELLSVIHDNRDDFQAMRDQVQATALKLADVLSEPNYDREKVQTVVNDFTTGANSLAARGGSVSMALFDKLTPEERILLAGEIRERATHEGKKR
jgi:uncharacterized membrane protein